MYKLSFLFIFVVLSFFSMAHKYYFGFAELEYNEMQKRFEGTLIFTQHDLEVSLSKQGKQLQPFEHFQQDSLTLITLETEFNNSFQLFVNEVVVKFKLIGFKSLKTGMLELYLLSDVIEFKDFFEVEFSTLMDDFPEQMNKLNFIFREKQEAITFTTTNRKKRINL
jgi:hypothetical protein